MADKPLTPESIKACRAALGLSQEAFAEEIGVTLRAVQYWECGKKTPSRPAAKLIRVMAARQAARTAAKRPAPR